MTRLLLEPAPLARAERALGEVALCDHCLGRLAGKVETGLSNDERGRLQRGALARAEVPVAACGLCGGLFDRVGAFAEIALDALRGREFRTYLVGTRVDEALLEAERELVAAVGAEGASEALNTELNREIGKRIAAVLPDVKVDFRDPHVTVVVDTRFDHATLQHGGLFLYGRYRKFERGIPQTRWPCRSCRGRGCVDCDGLGKNYETSVQELVEAVPRQAAGATRSAFHGAGREDVDARCLGTGRPFVLELSDPRVRTFDLASLERAVNAHGAGRVEVEGLRLAEKAEVVAVKEFRGTKTYRARVRFGTPVARERLLEGIGVLRATPVIQRTPSRVEHRRADKLRERRVLDVAVEAFDGTTATLRITGDAGLYIKELVSGDEGRTKPSVAELVGTSAVVEELDILAVEYEEPPGTKR